jgi:hypothetical protein
VKRPSFQFYPADWRNNAKLRRCSYGERGLWLEVMCLMHDSDEYGVLRWPLKEIAQVLGCRIQELQALVKRAVLKGADEGECFAGFVFTPFHAGKSGPPVTLIAPCDGPIWFSSRMLVDEYKRAARSPKGSLGDGPKHSPKGPPKPSPNITPKGGIGEDFGANQSAHHSRAGTRAGASSSSPSTASEGSNNGSAVQTSPAVLMAVALRDLGVKDAHGFHPTILGWVDAGVSVEQAKEAARIAVEDRGKRSPSCGYLAGIIGDMLQAPKPLNGTHAMSLDWWMNSDGVLAKARELKIEPACKSEDLGAGVDIVTTKCLIIRELGDGPWVDHKNATEMRWLESRSETA